jgi:hypothetical protein
MYKEVVLSMEPREREKETDFPPMHPTWIEEILRRAETPIEERIVTPRGIDHEDNPARYSDPDS